MKQPRTIRDKKKTLTPHEVARECGFGVNYTYKLLASGALPSIRCGNRFYIPRMALDKWLESCGGQNRVA